MPTSYAALMAGERVFRTCRWSDRDVILYALGIGLGREPLAGDELAYVYEKSLKVVPTFGSVIDPTAGAKLLRGIDYPMMVDAERKLTFHAPLLPEAEVITETRVSAVYDKGPSRGALIVRETRISEAVSGELLLTRETTNFARNDGGLGGPIISSPQAPIPPIRPPDKSLMLRTLPGQAVLYRLCGDLNPLHIDPLAAAKAGFKQPILHGMCTYGMSCIAVLKSFGHDNPDSLQSIQVRFVRPVFPGDLIRFDMWREDQMVFFEALVEERGSVLKHGLAVFKQE